MEFARELSGSTDDMTCYPLHALIDTTVYVHNFNRP
jgi:hypothetical protein